VITSKSIENETLLSSTDHHHAADESTRTISDHLTAAQPGAE